MKFFNCVMVAIVASLLMLGGCREQYEENNVGPEPIVILFENDVHCNVDGYPRLVTLRNACRLETENVVMVSCGDFASGGNVGSLSKGEKIVEIMNYVYYDVVTLGNHELDYGMEQMFSITEALNAEVVCANLKNVQTQEYPFAPYYIENYDGVKVAYIGFTTTTAGTITGLADQSGAPLYSFMRDEFYEIAQRSIDAAREQGADYVVALAHLGDTESGSHPSSLDLINRTTGLDIVIDGHDHHVIEGRMVADSQGNEVLLTSAGTEFERVGKIVIDLDGHISSTLVALDAYDEEAETKRLVERVKEEVKKQGDFVIGYSDVDLTIYNAEGERIVRTQEANIGDFAADAFRTFTGADIAMVNGGGLRKDLMKGQIRFVDLYNVMPFDDKIATGTLTGEQLVDILEFAVSSLPKEAGVFMQVSGLRFEVDSTVASPVVRDAETELFAGVGEGQRRVSNVEILDAQSGEYKAVDPSRVYTLATLDYLIIERGGDDIFDGVTLAVENWGAEIDILRHYIETELGGTIGEEYREPQGRIIVK